MALDNAQFISELSITDPPGSDPLSQGDDQIRATKRALQQSLPLLDKAVNIDADQMNLMAIKNEENLFTVRQDFDSNIRIHTPDAQTRGVQWHDSVLDHRDFDLSYNQINEQLVLRRYVGGVQQNAAWVIDQATGVMSIDQVPVIGGDMPLWIAGEVRMFVNTVTPGANWFIADGTNGTLNLQDRWLVGAGAFSAPAGTGLNASLDAQAAAGVTGSTAISEAQMPAHNHTVYRSNNSTGGITDAPLNTSDNVFAGRRNDASKVFSKTNGTRDLLGNTGSGAGHTHTTPVHDVIALNPTFTGSVQPVSMAVAYYQFVP